MFGEIHLGPAALFPQFSDTTSEPDTDVCCHCISMEIFFRLILASRLSSGSLNNAGRKRYVRILNSFSCRHGVRPAIILAIIVGLNIFALAQRNGKCRSTWLGQVCAGQRYMPIADKQRFVDVNVQCAVSHGRLACIVGHSQRTNCEGVWLGAVCDGQKFIDTFSKNPFEWQGYTCGFNSAKNFGGCIVPNK
jgi:hypothetical protein